MNNVILQAELNAAVCDCKNDLNKAQAALFKLSKLSDYPKPKTLSNVTVKRLASFVADRCMAVSNTPLYTQEKKDEIISDWLAWKIKAVPHVSAIESFVTKWAVVRPILEGYNISTADITEALTPRYTVEVPVDADIHLAKIECVRQAIKDLRTWESGKDAKKIPLDKLLWHSENEIIQAWSNGSMRINHEFESESSRVWREALYNATL